MKFLSTLFILVPQVLLAAGTPLIAQPPLEVTGRPGRFDYMEVDAARARVLAAHKQAGTLELVDLATGHLLPPVPVGHMQGIAIGSDYYVVGDEDEKQVVFVDAKTLKITGKVALGGPVDAVALDTRRNRVYADEDDGSHIWIIDARKKKLVKTITIPGIPEAVAYDPRADRVFQNIKDKDSVIGINASNEKIGPEWPTSPATGPHGLAIDARDGKVFVAGHNGKLVEIDIHTGKFVSQVDIAPSTDQIAFDSSARVIYCASKGFISAVQETSNGLQLLSNTPDHLGAHTIAVDSKRHEIWICYGDQSHSYLQKFTRGASK